MKLNSVEETRDFSNKISQIVRAGDIIFLYGEIGTGKTTFTRFFINNLESKNKIKRSEVLSPTFNIVYDYDVGSMKILHYDLYRLKNYNDISQLGMFETSDQYLKLIEWPELIKQKPRDRIDILFKYSELNNSRKVKIVGFGKWKSYKFDEI